MSNKQIIQIFTKDHSLVAKVTNESQMWKSLKEWRDTQADDGSILYLSTGKMVTFKRTKTGKLQMKIKEGSLDFTEQSSDHHLEVKEAHESAYEGYKFISKDLQKLLKECEDMI